MVGVGVGQWSFEIFAAKHDDKTMALAGLDDDLGVADFFDFGGEQGAQFLADFGFNAAGAAVGDDALPVEGAEIGAGGDVAGLELDAETERLDDAAANLEFQRVIAKEGEMAGTAAGSDAGGDGQHAALRGVLGEGVEVGRDGGFERRHKALLAGGDVAEAVEDEEDKLGFGL